MTFTRRVLSGTTQLTLGNGLVRLLSIVTMPILTTLLSPQVYGVATLAGTVISLVSVLGLAGVDMSYARAFHSAEPPSGVAVEQYCWRFAMAGAVVTGTIGGLTWWLFNRESVELDRGLAAVVAAGIVLSVASTMARARAALAGRYRAIALTIVVSGVIATAASIGIAALWRQDAMALLLPMLLGYLFPVLLLGTPPASELARPSGLSRKESAGLIRIGLAGVVTAPMYWLLSSSDRWFLQHFDGAEAVGIYAIGYSVAIVGMMINNAISSVWLFEATREYERDRARARVTLGRLMSRLAALMAIVWLVVAAAGGDMVRWLANERFHAAAHYVPYIAGGVFFYGVLQLANAGLLLAKQLNWVAAWWLAGGVVCTLLNLALVPKYGGMGAAVTQSASFGLMCIGILTTSQAKVHLKLDATRLAAAILVILAAGAFLAPPWHGTAPLSLLMKMPVGAAVAIAVGWLIAPDWCLKGIGYLRRAAFR